jgi:hypothetical protein
MDGLKTKGYICAASAGFWRRGLCPPRPKRTAPHEMIKAQQQHRRNPHSPSETSPAAVRQEANDQTPSLSLRFTPLTPIAVDTGLEGGCRKCRIKCRIYFLPPSIQKPLILRASQSIFLQSVACRKYRIRFWVKNYFLCQWGGNLRSNNLFQKDYI